MGVEITEKSLQEIHSPSTAQRIAGTHRNDPGHDMHWRLEKLNKIGIALSKEKDTTTLLENILLGAKSLTHADAGTLYLKTQKDTLKFEMVCTTSLGITMGGTSGKPVSFPEIPLYVDGKPNLRMVAAYAALQREIINIPDAYTAEGYDFSGTRAFDATTGYRSRSFLTIPLKDYEDKVIAVLQLINAIHVHTGEIGTFSLEDQKLAESLASQAAIALTRKKLLDDLKVVDSLKICPTVRTMMGTRIAEESPQEIHRLSPAQEVVATDRDRSSGDIRWRLEKLNEIGTALSTQKDINALLEQILLGAKDLTYADAGTLYVKTPRDTLKFEIFRTDSVGVAMGGTSGKAVSFPEIPLYVEGKPNLHMVAACVALQKEIINIPDAYAAEAAGFDFSGTQAFDAATGYRSQSFLTVPLKNFEDEVIAVLQLINATDVHTGEIVPFSLEDQKLAESLASQAAVALTRQKLADALKLMDDLKELFIVKFTENALKDLQSDAKPEDIKAVLWSGILARVEKLNTIGIALSSERDTNVLLENILLGAKELTNADAGTMYTKTQLDTLKFQTIRTDSLHIAMGGTTGINIPFPDLPLYRDGQPNLQMIAAYVALKDKTINIPDAYQAEGFDFSGTRAFDERTGYRSQSFLTVPLKNHENEIIGVLQLINAKDAKTGEIQPFSMEDQRLAESLASQAAVAMTNQKLINDLKELFESFIKVIANAIDEKSPYTGGHCQRVPILAEMLAKAAGRSTIGCLKDFSPTAEDLDEIRIAAWMHDCGKVVTPEHIVDKATKLETIYDRVHVIDTRFEVLKRDAEIDFLKKRLAAIENGQIDAVKPLEQAFDQRIAKLHDDRDFLRQTNIGGEFMSEERQNRVREIARYSWTTPEGTEEAFLTPNEVMNLNIPKGTLNQEEREIINHHVVATKTMLASLPFPKNLARVPEIAGSHHETMIGTGYPDKLTREQMSIPARIMVIADVFEALTATDRPYKPAKTLSESLRILGFMKKDQHIDPDLFKVFIDERIYEEYARAKEKYIKSEQIDTVIPEKIPGYER